MRKLSLKFAGSPSNLLSAVTMAEAPVMSAQDLLVMPDTVVKSGFLRHRQVHLKIVLWSQRFVVLTKDSVVVYDNERSKAPKLHLHLRGYNATKRTTSHKISWAFSVCSAEKSSKHQVFASASDRDRKEWMKNFRNVLYTANDIEKPILSVMQSFMESIDFEVNADGEYEALERPVFQPENIERKDSVTQSGSECDGDLAGLYEEVVENECDESDVTACAQPLPKSSKSKFHVDISSPPRYSAVFDTGYMNSPPQKPNPELSIENSLEKMCTLHDPSINRDRDKVIEMLRGTAKLGTYAIRLSRKDNFKVLSVLSKDNAVKEYKIIEEHDHFRLESAAEFVSVEALLQHYSNNTPLPGTSHFLVQGIYEEHEEGGVYQTIS